MLFKHAGILHNHVNKKGLTGVLREIKRKSGRILNDKRFRFIRFLFIGGINTLFSLLVYWGLVFLGIHYAIAVFISNMLGILFNFMTTSRFVFRIWNIRLFIRFILVYIITYILSVFALKLLFLVQVDKYIAAAIIALPMAVFSYLLLRSVVFCTTEKVSGSQ